MENQILDDGFENRYDGNQIQFVHWISLIILWIGIAYTGFIGLIGDIKVIAAIVLLVISTATTYFNYELGAKITFGIILIGIINLVNFFPIKYLISFGALGFELILLAIGIIHYFTNRKEVSKLLKAIFYKERSEEEIQTAKHSKINAFKRRFSNKKTEELEAIANNTKRAPEAIKAARELIEEKLNTL